MTDPIARLNLSLVPLTDVKSNMAAGMGFDLLTTIFAAQSDLMDEYHELEEGNGSPVIDEEDRGDLDSRRVQARIRELYGYTVQELSEAIQELKLKPWKRTEKATDREAYINEIGDVLHFFVELCITSGVGADELFAAYFRMHAKNVARQNSEY